MLQGHKAQLRATNTSWFVPYRSYARHWVRAGESQVGVVRERKKTEFQSPESKQSPQYIQYQDRKGLREGLLGEMRPE